MGEQGYTQDREMEQLIRTHIDYFQGLYIRTLNPLCLEIITNLKGLYERKDNTKLSNRKVVINWC